MKGWNKRWKIKKEQKVFEVQNNISNFVPDLVRGG